MLSLGLSAGWTAQSQVFLLLSPQWQQESSQMQLLCMRWWGAGSGPEGNHLWRGGAGGPGPLASWQDPALLQPGHL
jgi:hypothetical protein